MRRGFSILLVTACHASSAAPPASAPIAVAAPPPIATAKVVVGVDVHVERETADSVHPTRFQMSRRVAHYSTPNGQTGFVLDLTSEPARARVDGSAYVLELTPRRGSSGVVEYLAGSYWFRVSEETGAVVLFAGPTTHGTTRVVHDADAEPLPPIGF